MLNYILVYNKYIYELYICVMIKIFVLNKTANIFICITYVMTCH